jgi:hypothetical protein
VISALNKLRREEQRVEKELIAATSQREFLTNPWQFCETRLSQFSSKGARNNKSPSFNKDHADKFFFSTYKDKSRDQEYKTPLQLTKMPPPPTEQFNITPPTWLDVKKLLHKKLNNSCPGWDAIPYLVYKWCPTLQHYITAFFKRVWKEHQMPEGWQIAYIVLISKTSNTSSADQF